jgi:hypothetical protein
VQIKYHELNRVVIVYIKDGLKEIILSTIFPENKFKIYDFDYSIAQDLLL